VDLFFVLSGFLVSGLLFQEHKRLGTLSARRFLVRRGLKIYPAFYVLLLVTVATYSAVGAALPLRHVVGEAVFLQNYVGRLWTHTWSLAVEEHFYFLLALLMAVLLWISPKAPFRSIPPLYAVFAGGVLLLRVYCSWGRPSYTTYFYTHFRIDSLFFGVFLAYWYNIFPGRLAQFTRRPLLLLAVSCALISPTLVLSPDNFFMKTLGLTLLYLGFGGVLLLCVGAGPRTVNDSRLTTAVGYIGSHSYSIYLWHMPVLALAVWIGGVLSIDAEMAFLGGAYKLMFAGVYVAVSLAVGIAMSKLVEIPVLRWRDRFFPSVAAKPVTNDLTAGTRTGARSMVITAPPTEPR
jgi:peptidoglycan/LPS O-acetylase OafA/YrhL